MNEPVISIGPEYVAWARDNKKRADRLLAAAKTVITVHSWENFPNVKRAALLELEMAIIDYAEEPK
jgi:hypothetical protein